MSDFDQVLDGLIGERGGAAALDVAQLALLRQAARLLVNDSSDPRNANAIASLLALTPQPKRKHLVDTLEVIFVGAPPSAEAVRASATLAKLVEGAPIELKDAAENELAGLRGEIDDLRKRLAEVEARAAKAQDAARETAAKADGKVKPAPASARNVVPFPEHVPHLRSGMLSGGAADHLGSLIGFGDMPKSF